MPRGERVWNWRSNAIWRFFFPDAFLPVTQPIALRWGRLDGMRQLSGRPLSAPDGMIAATALEHDLTVVTRNVKDFEQLGVSILNPWPFE